MARLFEYEGKNFLKDSSISCPEGYVAETASEAHDIAARMGKPVVVKAQVWVGGRGKAGAIKLANSPEEAETAARDILSMNVKGYPVRKVLVEEKLDILYEFYAGVIPDSSRHVRGPVAIFSTAGGMDIEDVPEDKVHRAPVEYEKGLPVYDGMDLAAGAGVPNELLTPVAGAISNLVGAFKRYDCTTLEINPLVVTRDGRLVAGDCRMSIDENATFRQREVKVTIPREFPREPTDFDILGWWVEETDFRGSGFVMTMENADAGAGCIGFHAIGGGSAMIGIDALSRVNLKAANFADTSGNPVASKVYRVAKVILSQPGIEGYLLAGFMIANQEQWHHAHALVKALREEVPKKPGFPCVLLLAGNKERESLKILREGLAGLPGRIEIYGSERVDDSDFIGQRMLSLMEEYRKDKASSGGGK
ncbi:ATP-grasp domain-containing protein [Chloroflexota bacterium]